MKKRGKLARFRGWLRRVLGGIALHKSLEKNEKAARDLDAAVREVLQK